MNNKSRYIIAIICMMCSGFLSGKKDFLIVENSLSKQMGGRSELGIRYFMELKIVVQCNSDELCFKQLIVNDFVQNFKIFNLRMQTYNCEFMINDTLIIKSLIQREFDPLLALTKLHYTYRNRDFFKEITDFKIDNYDVYK